MTEEKQTAPAKPKPHIATGGALAAIVPTTLDETFRLAQALSMSGEMVPQHFQGRPEATMAAIVRGMEIGLAPMQALSNIAVINGRACLWGDAIPAIVQRHGHHIDVKVEGEGNNAVATATLTRGDTGKEVTRTFSMQDAQKAGLLQKKGPWQQYPKRMLMHRARSWAVRDGAADALMGLQVAEEVEDYRPMRDVTPQTGFQRLADKTRQEAAQADKDPDPSTTTQNDDKAAPAEEQDASDGPSDDTTTHDDPETSEGSEINPESPAYGMGYEAAEEGFIDRDCSPFKNDPEAEVEHLNWLAGYDAFAEAGDDTGNA